MTNNKESGDQCLFQIDDTAYVFAWIHFWRGGHTTPHLIPPQLRMTRFSASILLLLLLLLTPPLLSCPLYPLQALNWHFYHPTFTFTSTFTLPSYFPSSFCAFSFEIPLTFLWHSPLSPFPPLLRNLCCKSFSQQAFAYHSLCNHIPLNKVFSNWIWNAQLVTKYGRRCWNYIFYWLHVFRSDK